MKCPKCQYISFDEGSRCRNCGYEFSLSLDPHAIDEPPDPPERVPDRFADFSLEDLDVELPPLEQKVAAPEPPPAPRVAAAPRTITSSFDLPLFRAPDDDRPLVSAPAVPRAPLSVRKGAPVDTGAVPAHRPAPAQRRPVPYEPQLELEPEETARPVIQRTAAPRPQVHAPSEPMTGHEAATAAARILAALVDLALLGFIDATVLHYTLKVCGLTYAELYVLPVVPFVAFLLLLNGGYLTAFTAAGGQSIGKMLARIRVVPSDPEAWSDRVPLSQAVLRAIAYLLSALPLGLGFLPALFGDKRALHDRLARTRVVKA